jgi:hypothetical protein
MDLLNNDNSDTNKKIKIEKIVKTSEKMRIGYTYFDDINHPNSPGDKHIRSPRRYLLAQ